MSAKKENKFDDVEESAWSPSKCTGELNERGEAFVVFCQRLLGSSPIAPLVLGREVLNGASIGAIVEAFEACYPLTKTGQPVTGIASRRAELDSAPKEVPQ